MYVILFIERMKTQRTLLSVWYVAGSLLKDYNVSHLLLVFQVKGHLLLELLMTMAMDGQLQKLLLQLVRKFLLVHGCRYVNRTLADFLSLDSFADQLSHVVFFNDRHLTYLRQVWGVESSTNHASLYFNFLLVSIFIQSSFRPTI